MRMEQKTYNIVSCDESAFNNRLKIISTDLSPLINPTVKTVIIIANNTATKNTKLFNRTIRANDFCRILVLLMYRWMIEKITPSTTPDVVAHGNSNSHSKSISFCPINRNTINKSKAITQLIIAYNMYLKECFIFYQQ